MILIENLNVESHIHGLWKKKQAGSESVKKWHSTALM